MSIWQTFPELETERLRLRQIVADDTATWLALFNQPDVIRYLIDFDQPQTELAEVEAIIAWTQTIFSEQTGLRWAITLKPEPRMIGTCGFNHITRKNRSGEIGYELAHAYWRRGIMREALGAVLQFGFQQLALHRIEADVTVGNDASAGLLRGLGFTHEGTWRDKAYARGQFHGLWQFGLLAHEWRAR